MKSSGKRVFESFTQISILFPQYQLIAFLKEEFIELSILEYVNLLAIFH
ncbi:hypothetical protein HOA93_01130 [bacterium]|nr:hypothetical protein [bacterium]